MAFNWHGTSRSVYHDDPPSALEVLKSQLDMPPIYIVTIVFFIFGIVPPLVYLYAMVSKWLKRTKGDSTNPPFYFFSLPMSSKADGAEKEASLPVLFLATILESQILGNIKPKKGKDGTKKWKQKAAQCLTQELIPTDHYRFLNCTVRSLVEDPTKMIIAGVVWQIKGPVDDIMEDTVPEGTSSIKRLMAFSRHIYKILLKPQENNKDLTQDHYCVVCLKKSEVLGVSHGLAQFFLDDALLLPDSKPTPPPTKPEDSGFHISISFPICSKKCLTISMKAFQEITGGQTTHIEIEGEEEEEEKKGDT